MKIENLKIKHFGSIEKFETTLTSDSIVWCGTEAEVVLTAIAILTDMVVNPAGLSGFINNRTQLQATVNISGKKYIVRATMPVQYKGYTLSATSSDSGEDCSDEYLHLTHISCEETTAHIFQGNKITDYPIRLLKYKNPDDWFERKRFNKTTDCLGDMSIFRSYVTKFISSFSKEKLRPDKDFVFCLTEAGEFMVYAEGMDTRHCLSESEALLYNYLCLINLMDFWNGFEKIRNIHYVAKPLLISNFIERLDCSIDVAEFIARTHKFECQMHIALPIVSDIARLKGNFEFIDVKKKK